MGVPAYKAIINSSGTPTTMTVEACSSVGASGRKFQITSTSKRVLSREDTITVYGNGVLISSSNYRIDYFTGAITFGTSPATPVTVTGKYIPMSSGVAGAFSYNLSIGGDILSDDNFKQCSVSECHQNTYGLIDVSASMELHYIKSQIVEAPFDVEKLARTPVLIQFFPGGFNNVGYIGWFVVESNNKSGETSGMEDQSVSFQLDGDINASFAVVGGSTIGGVTFYGLSIPDANNDYIITGTINARPTYVFNIPGTRFECSWDVSKWNITQNGTFIARSRSPHGLTPDLVAQWETPLAVLITGCMAEIYYI